jgi:hypothetical protein
MLQINYYVLMHGVWWHTQEKRNRNGIVGVDHFTKIAVALAVKDVNGQAKCKFVEINFAVMVL